MKKSQNQNFTISQQNNIQPISFKDMFRFAQGTTKLYLMTGIIASIIKGICFPLFGVINGYMNAAFKHTNLQLFKQEIQKYLIIDVYIAIVILISCWIMYASCIYAAQNQSIACKKAYIKALFKQEISWFDKVNQNQLINNYEKYSLSFKQAIGEKLGHLISAISMLVTQAILMLYEGWKFGLVMISGLIITIIAIMLFNTVSKNKNKSIQTIYSKIQGKILQTLRQIKTVKSMNAQKFQLNNFKNQLQKVYPFILKYCFLAALANSMIGNMIILNQFLGYWYGAQLIQNNQFTYDLKVYTSKNIFVCVLLLWFGMQNLTQIQPSLKKINEGKVAAAAIFQIIDRQPKINKNFKGKIIKDNEFKGRIKFQNVSFGYPKSPNQIILSNLSFQINQNGFYALSGQSGCGKSTIFQLLMRFYDPLAGKITIDNIDIKQLNLQWLRNQISYVSQQPVLFATSIRQNLLLANPNSTEQEIKDALKNAKAYQFIEKLEQKLQTNIGSGGCQLSGGQKQRIAIARGLLKKSKIILLDQATSSLDVINQSQIRQFLLNIKCKIKLIMISHRLSSIKDADEIFLIQNSRIIESGKFKNIQKFKKLYDNKLIQQIKVQQLNINIKQKPIQNKQQVKQTTTQNQQQISVKQIIFRLIKYSKEDVLLFFFVLISVIAYGLVIPISNILTPQINIAIISLQIDKTQQNYMNTLLLLYFILAIYTLFFGFLRLFGFYLIAQNLTYKIQLQVYQKLLKLPVSWYQKQNISPQSLLNKIQNDCRQLNNFTSIYIGIIIQSIVTLIAGCFFSFYSNWKIALVSIVFLPILIGASGLKSRLLNRLNNLQQNIVKSTILTEGLQNIRTIHSFNCQFIILKIYEHSLIQQQRLSKKKSHITGILYGLSMIIFFLGMALLFYLSALLMNNITLQQKLKSMYARCGILYGALIIGSNSRYLSDIVLGKKAAKSIFKLLDQQDQQQNQTKQNSKLLKQGFVKGQIQFKNINFKYPSQKNLILQNFNLKIQGGKKTAIVGVSGIGKSTIIQLLLRFYEPQEGNIEIDGINIKDFQIHYLRMIFGLISQYPPLFCESIKYNIQYNHNSISMEKLVDISKKARAYNFIINHQNNEKNIQTAFQRNVGIGGSHISGGQKQRIIIARLLLKNPNILLLDQATSSLDRKNQMQVQQALDQMMQNKTTIIISHDLQTIKNSHKILVINKDKIIQEDNLNILSKMNQNY